jgi:hypothetical protein
MLISVMQGKNILKNRKWKLMIRLKKTTENEGIYTARFD